MTISTALVDEVVDAVSAAPIDEVSISKLRTQFEGVHFTYCMDDDIGLAKPVREEETFNIYLVDGREHCLCLTNDFDHATGIVVAEICDDDA